MVIEAYRNRAWYGHFNLPEPDYGINYLVLEEGGRVVGVSSRDICHANLTRNKFEVDPRKENYLFNRLCVPSSDSEEGIWRFYDYLLNESIFKDAFVDADRDTVLNNGLLLKYSTPRNYFLPAVQFARLFNCEYRNTISTMFSHYMEGAPREVHPIAALDLFARLGVTSATTYSYEINKGNYLHANSGHLLYRNMGTWYPTRAHYTVRAKPLEPFAEVRSFAGVSHSWIQAWNDLARVPVWEDSNFENTPLEGLGGADYPWVHSSFEELSGLLIQRPGKNNLAKTISFKKVTEYLLRYGLVR